MGAVAAHMHVGGIPSIRAPRGRRQLTRNWLMAPDPSLPRRLLAPRRPSLHGCIRCSAADECFGSANCLAERGGIVKSARADNQCLLHCALLFFFFTNVFIPLATTMLSPFFFYSLRC